MASMEVERSTEISIPQQQQEDDAIGKDFLMASKDTKMETVDEKWHEEDEDISRRKEEKSRKELAEDERRMRKEEKRIKEEAEKEKKKKKREEEKKKKEEEKNAKKQQEAAKEEEKRKAKEEAEAKKRREVAEKEEKRRKKEEEKEAKRLKDEAEQESKNRKRKEMEEKEAQRDEKRRRQEETLKKQANVMAKFLKRSSAAGNDAHVSKAETGDRHRNNAIPSNDSQEPSTVFKTRVNETRTIDEELASANIDVSIVLRNYQEIWLAVNKKMTPVKLSRWGVRKHPKIELVKELKLRSDTVNQVPNNQVLNHNELSTDPLCKTVVTDSEMSDCHIVEDLSTSIRGASSQKPSEVLKKDEKRSALEEPQRPKRRKLLQFHEDHRPAFYGSSSLKSSSVGPRHPLKKDSSLDYNYDSADEWEEEEPGESLSDSEKEDDISEGGEEDDQGDGFLVPDGYLSDDELQVESEEIGDGSTEPDQILGFLQNKGGDGNQDEVKGTINRKDRETAKSLKRLNALIERALRTNCPLVISSIGVSNEVQNQSNTPSGNSSGKTGTTSNTDDTSILQCLSMEVLTPFVKVEVPPVTCEDKTPDVKSSSRRTPREEKCLPRDVLVELVQFLKTSMHSMKRNVELLGSNFPNMSKNQLENAIRRVADYNGTCWEVKTEVLHDLDIQLPPATPLEVSSSPQIVPELKPITSLSTKGPTGSGEKLRKIRPIATFYPEKKESGTSAPVFQ